MTVEEITQTLQTVAENQVRHSADIAETDKRLADLAISQARTDEQIKALILSQTRTDEIVRSLFERNGSTAKPRTKVKKSTKKAKKGGGK